MIRSLFCVLLLISFFSCRKERIQFQWAEQFHAPGYSLEAIHFYNAEEGVAIGGATWFYGLQVYTTDGGQTWVEDSLTSKLMYDLTVNSDGRTFVVGVDGQILQNESQPAKGAWDLLRYQVWNSYRGIDVNEAGELLVVGGAAYQNGIAVRISSNYEMQVIDTLPFELSDVQWLDGQQAIAVGYGVVLRTENGGFTWEPLDIDGDFFRAVHFPDSENGYVVGATGTILKSTDGGRNWERIRHGGGVLQSDVRFRDLYFLDAERGYLVGEQGVCWRTRNGGEDWEVVEGLPEYDFYGISVQALSNGSLSGWLCGGDGHIIRFVDP
jgi:photosystem II stability/assembly factor-like uncharacterized protein